MNKHERMAEIAKAYSGKGVDPCYAGYFALFNQQKFYEAHDILEHLWLPDRQGVNGNFYKGLIQLAGAFVHLQKNRLKPSAALFKLAQANLAKYPPHHERLAITKVQSLINKWLLALEAENFEKNPLETHLSPQITLEVGPA